MHGYIEINQGGCYVLKENIYEDIIIKNDQDVNMWERIRSII